jgi:hypothetical protein
MRAPPGQDHLAVVRTTTWRLMAYDLAKQTMLTVLNIYNMIHQPELTTQDSVLKPASASYAKMECEA